jgi:[protein-PII] uridylyltransferase
VAWLVETHLVFSRTAQKEDISDPAVIAAFAARMGSVRRLTALYLLTVADIRGTSPKVWNAWKGKLLEDLYHAALAQLSHAETDLGNTAQKQAEARANLALYGLPEEAANAVWKHLDSRYFQRFEVSDIAWQARKLWRKMDAAEAVVRARLSPAGEGIQVLVYAADRPRSVRPHLRLLRPHPVHHPRGEDTHHPPRLCARQLPGDGPGEPGDSLPGFSELCGT